MKDLSTNEFDVKQQKLELDDAFKCPSCGANIEFDPDNDSLSCPYCGFSKQIERNTNVVERDFADFETHVYNSNDCVKTISCQNCGATEILIQDTVATKCPFCDSPLLVKEEKIDSLKPDSMVPFEFGEDKAKEYCTNWLKKRFYASSIFKKAFKLTNPKGIYYPIWTFDANTTTHYDGKLGKVCTKTTRDSKGNTHTTTYVKWFYVNGTRNDVFDDLVINASKYVDDKTMSKLLPFPQDKYVVYSNEYLAGYFANRYTIDPYTAFKSASERMQEYIRKNIVASYHADRVAYLNLNTTHNSKSFKSMYVPIYVTGTKYKEKLYSQYVNGSTGRVTGNFPKSVFKITLTVILGLALLALLVLRIINP